MKSGVLIANCPLVTSKKISKRSESAEQIFQLSMEGLKRSLELAARNNWELVISGSLIRDNKEFKIVSDLIRLLSQYEAPYVMLDDAEVINGKLSDNSVIGILGAANVIKPVWDKTVIEWSDNGDVFEVVLLPCSTPMPRRFAAKKISDPSRRLVVANHQYGSIDSFRGIGAVGTVVVPSFRTQFSQLVDGTYWIAPGELLRTDPVAEDYAPTVISFDSTGTNSLEMFALESPFNDSAVIHESSESSDPMALSDSAFVTMLQSEAKNTELSLAKEIQYHIESLIDDESVSESTREIVSFLYGEVVFSEESDLAL